MTLMRKLKYTQDCRHQALFAQEFGNFLLKTISFTKLLNKMDKQFCIRRIDILDEVKNKHVHERTSDHVQSTVQSLVLSRNRSIRHQENWQLINFSIDPRRFASTDRRDTEFRRFFSWSLTALPNRIAGRIAVHLTFQADRHSLDDRNSKTR